MNSWVEDEVVLLKCVNLDFFLTTLLFFGGLSARDIPLSFPKMKQAFKGTMGVSELSHPNAYLTFTSYM